MKIQTLKNLRTLLLALTMGVFLLFLVDFFEILKPKAMPSAPVAPKLLPKIAPLQLTKPLLWEAPAPRNSEKKWAFELFTPPAIELFEGKPAPLTVAQNAQGDLNFEFLSFEGNSYPLGLEGFTKFSGGKICLFIRDRLSKELFEVSQAGTFDEGRFTAATPELKLDGRDGVLVEIPEVRICERGQDGSFLLRYDGETRQDFTLKLGVKMASKQEILTLHQIGEVFRLGAQRYMLEGVNAAQKTATLRPLP